MAVLKVLKGGFIGQILELDGERVVLGRHPNCKIVLDNAAVSRNHAQILESHGSYFLEDLRSRNGTQLNGKTITGRQQLAENDRVQVCDLIFSFHLGLPPTEEGPTAAGVAEAHRATLDLGDSSPVPILSSTVRTSVSPSSTSSIPIPPLPGLDDLDGPDKSSILSTLSVSSFRKLQWAVKPEAKLRAILDISSSLGKTLQLGEVLPKILEGLFRIFPQADRGFVLLRDPESGELRLQAMRLRKDEQADSAPMSRTVVRQALETREAILSENAAEDRRFNKSDSVANLRIHSMMCVPLVSQDDQALGVIQIDTQDVRYRFHQDDLDLLASVACLMAVSVENAALHEEMLARRDLERELDFATQVQIGFLPTDKPSLPEYEFYDFYEAAQRVGGDFYDYVALPDGRLAVALGDVAGKGIPAALLMARLYSMVRYQLLTEPTAAGAMNALNASLTTSGLGHRFITFVLGILDPRNHTLTVVNAGHHPPLLRLGSKKVVSIGKETAGLPLGVRLDGEYQETTLTLHKGDLLVFFTDGLNEAMNPQNDLFGVPRMAELIASTPGGVQNVGEKLVDEIEKFGEGRPQRDDMCLVCFRRKE